MYRVPGLRLIVQHKDMACWYASARMVIQWKRKRLRVELPDHPDPSQVKEVANWEVNNAGITNPQVIRLAQMLGLRSLPPQCPTPALILDLLKKYGPLWTNGKRHIVVIGGVDEVTGDLLIYDPWPPGLGKIEWRKFRWYVGDTAPDSMDTSDDVQATILYHP